MTVKIKFDANGMGRTPATVWHNDTEHALTPGETLDLAIHKGDTVRFRVGKLSASHTIAYQSPSAQFLISVNKMLQLVTLTALLVLVGGLWYFTNLNNFWLSTVAVLALVGYEVANYFWGFQAQPIHGGD